MIKIEKVKPTGVFTNYIYKAIPLAFDESMSYYETLCGLLAYLKDTILPVINNNADATIEVQNMIIELQNYVDNYFSNLDIQEEINNKLDEMVEDGTFDEIINQTLFNELDEQIDANTSDISDIKDDILDIDGDITNINLKIQTLDNEKIKEIRKRYYANYHIFEFPNSIPDYLKNVTIYESYDKKNYKYGIDIDSLKVTGGNTYYVDAVNGDDSNNGTSDATPWQSMTKVFNTNDVANGTVYVKKGIYYRTLFNTNSPYNKLKYNMNIICEKGTIMGMFDQLTWTQNSQYSNVYEAVRSNVNHVIDIRGLDNDVLAQLPYVSSLSACSDTLNSYYADSTKVYVNIGESVTNNKILCTLKINANGMNVDCPSQNKALKLYLENAICLSGNYPFLNITSSSSYKAEFIGKNCKFMYKQQTDNVYDGVELRGSDSILIDCDASCNGKDGFNYHAINGQVCNAIEINCKASYNGLHSGDNYSNGSTIHDGGQIIRINGTYFNNHGGNVTDVNDNTKSYNFNCTAFDSLSDGNNFTDSDFNAQQSGVAMYLYNCYAKGNSKYNLYCIDGANMFISNTEYDRSDGTITEI